MIHYGDFAASKTVRANFNTADPTGAPITLAGAPAVAVYKDDSLVQSVAGVTLTVDFDGVTGLQHVAVDLSADLAFYSAGSDFSIVLTTGTVNGISIAGTVIGSFSMVNRLPAVPVNFATLAIDANGRVKALVDVQKNVALGHFTFLLTDSTIHQPLTGKVNGDFLLKQERIDAAATAALSGTITEVDATNQPGIYDISLIAGELNGQVITLYFQTVDSDPTVVTLVTSA